MSNPECGHWVPTKGCRVCGPENARAQPLPLSQALVKGAHTIERCPTCKRFDVTLHQGYRDTRGTCGGYAMRVPTGHSRISVSCDCGEFTEDEWNERTRRTLVWWTSIDLDGEVLSDAEALFAALCGTARMQDMVGVKDQEGRLVRGAKTYRLDLCPEHSAREHAYNALRDAQSGFSVKMTGP